MLTATVTRRPAGRHFGARDQARDWPTLQRISRYVGLVLAATLLGGLTAACTPSQSAPVATVTPLANAAASPAGAQPSATRPEPGASSPPPESGVQEALVRQAVADASAHTGVPASAVRVVAVSERLWPDRSLGCPQPGMGYAQAVTPGYLIAVEAGGQALAYHTDQARVVRCDR